MVETNAIECRSGQDVLADIEGELVPCRVAVTAGLVAGSLPAPVGEVVRVLTAGKEDLNQTDAANALDSHQAATLPVLGQTVSTSDGVGRVVRLDVPRRLVRVCLESGGDVELPAAHVVSVDMPG
jgi:hypothetical protein